MTPASLLLTTCLSLTTASADAGPSGGLTPAKVSAPTKSLEMKTFGVVEVSQPKDSPIGTVVLVSGDDGWSRVLAHAATRLSESGYLVLGVDVRHYLAALRTKRSCAYPGGDLAALSQYAQKQLRLGRYLRPVLVGYASGAALAYAALAQAPEGTFRGAVSLGFCPELTLPSLLCGGSGLLRSRTADEKREQLLPSKTALGWRVLQGEQDKVCPLSQAEAFVAQVPGAALLSIPTLAHRATDAERTARPVLRAVEELAQLEPAGPRPPAPPEPVDDLPLIEVPAMGAGGHELMALIVSGDGGWSGPDRVLAQSLNNEGVPVLGLSSLSYFWTARTPDETAKDLARAARHYLRSWKKPGLVLIGSSRGANVLPAVVARWSEELRQRLRLIVLVGPGSSADFEVRGTDVAADARDSKLFPILPEVIKLGDTKILCVAGDEEKEGLCAQLRGTKATVVKLKGSYPSSGDYAGVAREILKAIP